MLIFFGSYYVYSFDFCLYYLEVIEFLHRLSLDLITYVDVGLHRLVIIISQNAYEKMVFLKLIKSKSKCTHF